MEFCIILSGDVYLLFGLEKDVVKILVCIGNFCVWNKNKVVCGYVKFNCIII